MIKQLVKLAVCLCVLSNVYAASSDKRYVMVVDAGSTGSRLHLFSYQPASTPTVVPIDDLYYGSVQPGLSANANDPAKAGASLAPLLDGASAKLAALHVNPEDVSISVLGTGGMRLLAAETQAAIYASVAQSIQAYHFKIDQIKTISGKMEGVYGWLDVNYLMGTLVSNNKTYGNIDMGGASTQISFETNQWSDPENQIKLVINGRERIIYSKSFNGLGLEESRKQMNQSKIAPSCYPYRYKVSEVGYGRFNLNLCGFVYKDVINKHQVREQVKFIPEQTFIAYSGAYKTLHFFGLDDLNRGAVESRLQSLCTRSWEELRAAYPTVSEKDLSSYCANGVFLDDLFYSGYRFHDGQVRAAAEIDNKTINWALGVVVFGMLT